MTTEELMELLRKRHTPAKGALREWALFPQVRSEAWNARTADAIAVNLWESRGQAIHGLRELKVSRPDWLKELRAPEKAEAIARYCDYWCLVLADGSIVRDEEVPDGWGILVPRKDKLFALRKAEKREAKVLTRSFLVEILRAAYNLNAPEHVLAQEYERGRNVGREEQKRTVDTLQRSYDGLSEVLQVFERTSGIRIANYQWNGHDPVEVGKAVRTVLDGDRKAEQLHSRLRSLASTAKAIQEEIERLLEEA